MKIVKLEIKKFGKFRNLSIDLSKNLNLIFGLNESGKTMIVDAIEHSLFSKVFKAEHEHHYTDTDVEITIEKDGKNYVLKKGEVVGENMTLEELESQFEILSPKIFESLYCVKASDMQIKHEREIATKLGELLLNVPSINKIEDELKKKLTKDDLISIYNFRTQVLGGECEQEIKKVEERIDALEKQLPKALDLRKNKLQLEDLRKNLEIARREESSIRQEYEQIQKLKEKERLQNEIEKVEREKKELEDLIKIHEEFKGLSEFSDTEKKKIDEIREKLEQNDKELNLEQTTLVEKINALEIWQKNMSEEEKRYKELQLKKSNLQKDIKPLEQFTSEKLQNMRNLEHQKLEFERIIPQADLLTKQANDHQAEINKVKKQRKRIAGYGIALTLFLLIVGVVFIVIAVSPVAMISGIICAGAGIISGFGVWLVNYFLQARLKELNQKIEKVYNRLGEITKECQIQASPDSLLESLKQTVSQITHNINEFCITPDVKNSEDFEKKVYSKQMFEKELADVENRIVEIQSNIERINSNIQDHKKKIEEIEADIKQLQKRVKELKDQEESFYKSKGIRNYFDFMQKNKKWQKLCSILESKRVQGTPEEWGKKLTDLQESWHRLDLDLDLEYRDVKRLRDKYDKIQEEIVKGRLDDINEKIRKLEKEQSSIDGAIKAIEEAEKLDELEIQREIGHKKEELEKLQQEARAYAEVAKIFKDIKEGVDKILPDVYKNAEEKFAKISGHTFKVEFEEKYWKPRLIDQAGTKIEARAYLSSGALHQLYFCLRLALIENLAKQKPIFIILDDPFIFFDHVRLQKTIFEVVLPLSQKYQFIITTIDQKLKEILGDAGANIINL